MPKIFFAIHAVVMTALMGIGIIAVLTMGMPGWKPLVLAAAVGFVLSIPVSWIVSNRIEAAIR